MTTINPEALGEYNDKLSELSEKIGWWEHDIVATLEDLDNLRDEGSMNMFGATTWLQNELGMQKNDARAIHAFWMRTFSERHPDE